MSSQLLFTTTCYYRLLPRSPFSPGDTGSEQLSYLPKVTQTRSERSGIGTWQPDFGVPNVPPGLNCHPPLPHLRPVQGDVHIRACLQLEGAGAASQAIQRPVATTSPCLCQGRGHVGRPQDLTVPLPACVPGHFQPRGFGGPWRTCLVLADQGITTSHRSQTFGESDESCSFLPSQHAVPGSTAT